MRGSKVRGNNLDEGLGCRGNGQGLPGQCPRVAGAMYKGCLGSVLTSENKVNSFCVQLKVELGLQVKEGFDNKLGLSCAKLSTA